MSKLKAQKLSGHISNLLAPFSRFLFIYCVLKWTGGGVGEYVCAYTACVLLTPQTPLRAHRLLCAEMF